jgi:DNA-binding transcriptional ArsR family regulator
MAPKRKTEQAAALAGILSNPMRLAIVQCLRERPTIVGDLVEAVGESQATVSKQLGILRDAGLLQCRPDGRCREYALASPLLVDAALEALHTLATQAAAMGAKCRARRSTGPVE